MLKVFKKNHGFTLIELLVVIAIIGILLAAGTVSFQRSVRLSRDSRRQADLEQIRQALETYRSIEGNYPATALYNTGVLVPDYINELPVDPNGGSYVYVSTGNTIYSLCSYLEGPTGSSSCSGVACGANGETCNYEVKNP